MRQMMCVFKLNEESRKYQEWADKEIAKNAAVFHVKDWPTQQPQSLSNETYEQINEEKTGEPEDFKWLLGHEVRDKNVNDGAEHLDRNVGHNETNEVSTNWVPAIEVLTFNYR